MTSAAAVGKTLLIAEDDNTTREALGMELGQAGYGVVLVGNGQEALDYLDNHPAPDLILLDMCLPVLDGWHFLQQVRESEPRRRAPILITTATIISREWALSHGCAGFIKKPIETDELLQEIDRALATGGPQG